MTKEITNAEIDRAIKQISDTTIADALKAKKSNPLTLYATLFIGDDGKKRGCVFTHRPRKELLKRIHTFVTDKNGHAVEKLSNFMKLNNVVEYKLVE